jgi:hypothetical protein
MLNRGKIHIVLGLVIGCLTSLITVSLASEPTRPEFDRVLDRNREDSIQNVSNLSSTEVLKRLKDVDYIADDYYMRKTIYKSFHHRKMEGIDQSLQKLSLPEKQFTNGNVIHRTRDLYIGKKIFETFPEDSVPRLLKLYESGDAVTKGNVIRVSGNLAGPAVDRLLMTALYDKTVCEQEYPELDGSPMRVCDLAYNQLVLRFNIQNVLRTIGPIYRLETRDYHITILKGRLMP